jgi:hypothetical protein
MFDKSADKGESNRFSFGSISRQAIIASSAIHFATLSASREMPGLVRG